MQFSLCETSNNPCKKELYLQKDDIFLDLLLTKSLQNAILSAGFVFGELFCAPQKNGGRKWVSQGRSGN